MNNINTQDERIISQRRKIQSDAYQILIYCLLISIVIQQFILNAPFSQFAVELLLLIGMGIHMTIRHLTAGINIWSTEHTIKKILINGATSGAISVVLLAVLSGNMNIGKLIVFFLSFTSFYFIVNLLLQYINKKKQKQIDDELDCDETKD